LEKSGCVLRFETALIWAVAATAKCGRQSWPATDGCRMRRTWKERGWEAGRGRPQDPRLVIWPPPMLIERRLGSGSRSARENQKRDLATGAWQCEWWGQTGAAWWSAGRERWAVSPTYPQIVDERARIICAADYARSVCPATRTPVYGGHNLNTSVNWHFVRRPLRSQYYNYWSFNRAYYALPNPLTHRKSSRESSSPSSGSAVTIDIAAASIIIEIWTGRASN